MQLTIQRSQKVTRKRMSEVILFVASFQLEVTAEEETLIKRYILDSHVLGNHPEIWSGQAIAKFRQGVKFEADDVDKVLVIEEEVKQDCEKLKDYLQRAALYQEGEEKLTY